MMPDDVLGREWDFLTLVAWWNLYGLPALLVLAAAGLILAPRRRAFRSDAVAVRAMALIHLGLGLRAGIRLAQELLTLRDQGIPQSFPLTGIVLPAVSVVVNPALGHYLWRFRPWARRLAIAWSGLAGLAAALVVFWQWRFHVGFHPDHWPDDFVAMVLPWLLVVLLLLPGPRSLFQHSRSDAPALALVPRRPPVVAIVAVLLLLIVASALGVDALDWLIRSVVAGE